MISQRRFAALGILCGTVALAAAVGLPGRGSHIVERLAASMKVSPPGLVSVDAGTVDAPQATRTPSAAIGVPLLGGRVWVICGLDRGWTMPMSLRGGRRLWLATVVFAAFPFVAQDAAADEPAPPVNNAAAGAAACARNELTPYVAVTVSQYL